MALKPQRTIAAVSSQVTSAFSQLISKLVDPSCNTTELNSSTIQDEQGRFHVWAGNIGALQSPGSVASLDSRLSDAPQIKEQVCKIMVRLNQSIEKGKCFSGLEKPKLTVSSNINRFWGGTQ